MQARSSGVSRPWGGRWLGLDHLLAKCALAHLAAQPNREKKLTIFKFKKFYFQNQIFSTWQFAKDTPTSL
jgi:hypothetical protein